MFDLIRANKRRSMVLVICMLLLLLSLGFLVGAALLPGVGMAMQQQGAPQAQQQFQFDPTGGFIGMAIAGVIWIVQALVAYFSGDAILLRAAGARKIEKEDAPQLFNVVEEMTIASQLSKMPDVYIIEDRAMNAFAAGRKEETAKVAITSGLLERLNRDQLQGVMAHEIAHIKHRDVLFMTMIGVMVGTIILLSDLFLRSLWYSSATRGRRYGGSKKGGGGQLQIILIVLAILLAILAPILAQFIYFACSRRREYLADAGAAVYTRYPEGLASALEVLSGDSAPLQRANRATAPMYIVNPLRGATAFSLHATHPPTKERIQILRSMAGGVSYANYQAAWRQQDRGAKMPRSIVQGEQAVPMREADPSSKQDSKKSQQQRMRETGDMLRSMHHFLFIPCACGTRIKLPPEWKKETAKCPRCKRVHTVPAAHLATAAAAGEILTRQSERDGFTREQPSRADASPEPLAIEKKRGEWQTFQCSCGRTKNLAPSFEAPRTRYSGCGREIRVNLI